ncbi:MAG: hypothetical protein HYY57_02635 [Candidatus Omnitrophica bacterium]|nr:hypothetical protein [Candidatus Omnitrophota bacterium]
METWKISEDYLKTLRRSTLALTLPCWFAPLYILTIFAKHDLWNAILRADPFMAAILLPTFLAIVITPLLGVWYLKVFTQRAQATLVSVLDDRLIKRVKQEEQSVLFSELSEVLLVRSRNGTLRSIRLVTQKGPGLVLAGLDRFEDLLTTLTRHLPHCPVHEWRISLNQQRVLWFIGLAGLFLFVLSLQGIISPTVFYYLLFGIVILLFWYQARTIPRGFRSWQDLLISSQLGSRYRWLDFVLGAVVLCLWVSTILEGVEALYEGHLTNLPIIFFTPLVLTWLFLVPLVRSVQSNRTDRGLLIVMLSVVMIGFPVMQMIERRTASPSKAATKGLQYIQEKRYEAAIPHLQQAYRQKPDQVHLAEHLAYAYSMSGKYQDVIHIWEERIQDLKELSDYSWQLLAHACQQTGEWERLLSIAESAISTKGHSVEAYHVAGLAASQIYGLHSDEAKQYYAKYVELNPNTTETGFVKELFPDLTVVANSASLHGSWIDHAGEIPEKYVDLFTGSLYAENRMADLELGIHVAGLHPEGQSVRTQFEVLWDTDNDVRTGVAFGLFQGVDKILRIQLEGFFPFNESYGTTRSTLYDVDSGNETPLPAAKVTHINLIADSALPEGSKSLPLYDAIDQKVPLTLLKIEADQVPVGIRATNLDTGLLDIAAFEFDYNPWFSPHVKINPSTAFPGQPIEYTGRRFSPHNTVRITLGDTEILKAQADAQGDFLQSVPLPDLPPGDYLIRAVDDKQIFYLSLFRVQAPNPEE